MDSRNTAQGRVGPEGGHPYEGAETSEPADWFCWELQTDLKF